MGKFGSVVFIGEGMVECGAGRSVRKFGGDVMNTAVYFAQLGGTARFVSSVGDDTASADLLVMLSGNDVDISAIRTRTGSTLGSYHVTVAEDGERSFSYDRGGSPFAQMALNNCLPFNRTDTGFPATIYLSGITLAVVTSKERANLFELLGEARKAGSRLVFDTNYRRALWQEPQVAREAYDWMFAMSDTVFLGAEDLRLLPVPPLDPVTFARPTLEVVYRKGADGSFVSSGDRLVQIPAFVPSFVIDTTAAGDSFNAAYLAAREAGASPERAAVAGSRLASLVVGHRGALMPQNDVPSIQELLARDGAD